MDVYTVEPYIWIRAEKGYIFQTRLNTVLITDNKMSWFLIKLEEKGSTELTDHELENEFNNNRREAINFLLENSLIKKKAIVDLKGVDIEHGIFVSNDMSFGGFADKIGHFVFDDFKDLSKIEKYATQNKLIYFFLNPFSVETLYKISDLVRKNKCVCKFIFTYNNKIYFTNFHKKEWYNPCPRCFFSELESQLRNEPSETNINFQLLVDLIYEKTGKYYSNLPLNNYDYFQIMGILTRDVKPDESNINLVYALDLNTYTVEKDIAYHWGYCDCYE